PRPLAPAPRDERTGAGAAPRLVARAVHGAPAPSRVPGPGARGRPRGAARGGARGAAMSLGTLDRPLVVVVGGGGVGKTTLAAALGVVSAEAGTDTLVRTFDPSRRLKDALGVGEAAGDRETPAPLDAPGRLDVSLL